MRIFSLIMVCSAVLQLHGSAPASTSDDGRKSPYQEKFAELLTAQQSAYNKLICFGDDSLNAKQVRAAISANIIALTIAQSNREQQKEQAEALKEIRDLLRAQQSAAHPVAKPAERREGEQ